jgi:hypothetical protein
MLHAGRSCGEKLQSFSIDSFGKNYYRYNQDIIFSSMPSWVNTMKNTEKLVFIDLQKQLFYNVLMFNKSNSLRKLNYLTIKRKLKIPHTVLYVQPKLPLCVLLLIERVENWVI